MSRRTLAGALLFLGVAVFVVLNVTFPAVWLDGGESRAAPVPRPPSPAPGEDAPPSPVPAADSDGAPQEPPTEPSPRPAPDEAGPDRPSSPPAPTPEPPVARLDPQPQPAEPAPAKEEAADPAAAGTDEPTDRARRVVLLFETGKISLDEDEKVKLVRLVRLLRKNPGFMLSLEGHADQRGGEEMNQNLSELRVTYVRRFLKARNIGPDRIKTAAFGETRPADPSNNPRAWEKNRRVVVHIHEGEP